MANKEEEIKNKMLDALQRAIDDPHMVDDKEWSRLFGAASLARAMAIVSKLNGRVTDDAATLAENHDPLTKEERECFAAWLDEGVKCSNCGNLVIRCIEDTMPAA